MLRVLSLCALCLALCGQPAGEPRRVTGRVVEPVNTTICEIVKNPADWSGRTVRLIATIRIAFEQFDISAEACTDRKLESMSLEYASGPKNQPTTWCCGDLTPRGPITLNQNAEFKKFHRLLTAQRRARNCPKPYCFANDVTAELTGQLETGNIEISPDGEHYSCPSGGFGHFGFICARLVIQEVKTAKALRRR